MTKTEYNKQLRARRVAQGICRNCLVRPATEGKKTCAECRQYNKQYAKQYYVDNREERLERKKQYAKQYYVDNREERLERKKQYAKQYHADNREERLEYLKNYAAIKRSNDLCVVYAILIAGFKYIGSTHTYERRKAQHLSDLRLGKHANKALQALYNDHGPDALEFVVLATLEKETTELARRAIEQTYIDDTSPHLLLNEVAACRYCDAAYLPLHYPT